MITSVLWISLFLGSYPAVAGVFDGCPFGAELKEVSASELAEGLSKSTYCVKTGTDQKHGKVKSWYSSGKIKFEGRFDNGRLIYAAQYAETGEKLWETSCEKPGEICTAPSKCQDVDRAKVNFISSCAIQMGLTYLSSGVRKNAREYCRCIALNFKVQAFADEKCDYSPQYDFYPLFTDNKIELTCGHLK